MFYTRVWLQYTQEVMVRKRISTKPEGYTAFQQIAGTLEAEEERSLENHEVLQKAKEIVLNYD